MGCTAERYCYTPRCSPVRPSVCVLIHSSCSRTCIEKAEHNHHEGLQYPSKKWQKHCWIPSHVGILGNEKADAAAKSALSLPVTHMKLPATGMYPRITKLIFDEWQEVWNCCAGNKLHAIRPTVLVIIFLIGI